MTSYSILSLTTLILSLFLCFYIFFNNKKQSINKNFSLLILSAIFWIFSNFITDNSKTEFWVLFWSKATLIGPVLIAYFFYRFSILFPKVKYVNPLYGKLILIIAIIFILLSPTSLNIADVFINGNNIPEISPGYLYWPFLVYFLFVIVVSFLNIFKDYLLFTQSQRAQVFLVVLGMALSVILGIFTNLILPLFGRSEFVNFGPYFVLLFIIFTSYAIVKHGFFNIKTIATELLTFAIWIAVLFELLIADTWKERLFEGGLLLFVIVFGILLIKSVLKEVHQREEMEKLSKELEKLNSQLSVRTQQLTSLKDFTTSLIRTLDFREIIQIIVDGIVERFNYAGVFLTGITDDGKYLYPLAWY